MHIVFATPEYPSHRQKVGGLAAYVQKTSQELVGRGYQVAVFVFSDRFAHRVESGIEIFEIQRFSIKRVLKKLGLCTQVGGGSEAPLVSSGFSSWLDSMRMSWHIFRYHKKKPISICQSSDICGPTVWLSILNRSFPLLCRCSGGMEFYRLEGLEKWTMSDWLMNQIEKFQIKFSDFLICPSELIRRYLASWIDKPMRKIPTLPPKVNIDFSVEKNEVMNFGRYLLFVGSLSYRKGVDLIFNAISSILESEPDLNMVFIGKDLGMNGKKFFPLDSRFNSVRNRIHYLGPISKPELFYYMHLAAAVLLPSRKDNFPNVCLEALSVGGLVVGSDQSSIEEIIEDGQSGFVFKNSNVEDLKRKIIECLNMLSNERSEMKLRVSSRLNQLYTTDSINELIDYYRFCIDKFSSGRASS